VSRSPLVGKAAEFVLIEDEHTLVRRRGGRTYTPTRFLAGGALFMSRDALDAVGGWGSVPRSVDQDLIERFERVGFRTVRVHGYEFVLVRHGRGHTWDADPDYFIGSADEVWSAEAIDRVGLGAQRPPDRDGVDTDVPAPASTAMSICVPNKDGVDAFWLWQQRCATWPSVVDLVVADDRSSPPLVAGADDDRVTVVRVADAPGFGAGRARHSAAAHAAGDVLLFVDADVDIGDDVIAEVIRRYLSGYQGAVHAAISFVDIDAESARRTVERVGLSALRREFVGRAIEGQLWRERHWAASADLSEPRSSSFRAAVGAFLAVDAATYRATGGFRDVDIRGVEDTEFGYRLLMTGCDQVVLRGGDIVHLGERTFSSALEGDEAVERERRLAAFVPIWARSLTERRSTLDGTEWEPVPFVWSVDQRNDCMDELNEAIGPGTAFVGPWTGTVFGGPFALALDLDPLKARQAVQAAYGAFRSRAGGEVVVTSGGHVVGRFVAVWSANRARRRLGRDVDAVTNRAGIGELLPMVRRYDRTAIVTI
ncbi:MAG: hypothetical protein RLZZ01_2615, partial [Actinomycetota bacterium]